MPDQFGFRFLDTGSFADGDLTLTLGRRIPPDPAKGWVATHDFEMPASGTEKAVGTVSFRAQDHPLLELRATSACTATP